MYVFLVTFYELNFQPICELVKANEDQKGSTLIHCMAGRSRSATLTIAYLLWNEGIENTSKYKVYNVLDTVQAKRPIVQPNAAFIKQLVQWEDQLKSQDFRNSIQLNEAQSIAINEIQQITQRIKKQEC